MSVVDYRDRCLTGYIWVASNAPVCSGGFRLGPGVTAHPQFWASPLPPLSCRHELLRPKSKNYVVNESGHCVHER